LSLIECVPNFSEGRDKKTIDAIACAIQSVQGVQLLHTDIGYDANRTVFTFIGEPHNVMEAAYRSIKTASQLIDMRNHTGAHPRIGACDVCPIIPIHAIDIEACNSYVYELSHRLAELNIPVFLYEKSTNNTYRKHLEDIRKGEYEGLEIKMNDTQWKADNDIKFNPKFGAMVLGVRNFLIAYNINLNTNDVTIAKKIAKKIRTSNNESITFPKYEKLPYLKSIGWYMEQYHCAQVSTNITDYHNNRTIRGI
jgi:glutamate formiminotransferase